jgi:hypothetical protein
VISFLEQRHRAKLSTSCANCVAIIRHFGQCVAVVSICWQTQIEYRQVSAIFRCNSDLFVVGYLKFSSFVYIRIIAVWELVFFFIPYPLSLLTEVDTIGDTWLSANFLPAFLGGWYLATIFMIFCFAIRLQLIINYLRVSFHTPQLRESPMLHNTMSEDCSRECKEVYATLHHFVYFC